MLLAAIPSPSRSVLHLGPLPLRAYALMIILGIIAAVMLTSRRLRARGVDPVLATDAVFWAVPFGIVGARLYHVVSSPDAYFGENGDLLGVFRIWEGGLAIWGAIAGGALGAWVACRRAGVSYGLFADAVAPGLALAQAIGRWGNWFNQELYGRPTDLPWALRIDPDHRVYPDEDTYHPTFLYESLWNLGVMTLLLWVDRRHRLGRSRLFFLYVAAYTAGRLWIEALRIDDAERVAGLRVNIWVAGAVFLAAVAALLLVRRPVDPDAPFVPGGPGAAGTGATGESGESGGPAGAAGAEEAGGTDKTDASGASGESGEADGRRGGTREAGGSGASSGAAGGAEPAAPGDAGSGGAPAAAGSPAPGSGSDVPSAAADDRTA